MIPFQARVFLNREQRISLTVIFKPLLQHMAVKRYWYRTTVTGYGYWTAGKQTTKRGRSVQPSYWTLSRPARSSFWVWTVLAWRQRSKSVENGTLPLKLLFLYFSNIFIFCSLLFIKFDVVGCQLGAAESALNVMRSDHAALVSKASAPPPAPPAKTTHSAKSPHARRAAPSNTNCPPPKVCFKSTSINQSSDLFTI